MWSNWSGNQDSTAPVHRPSGETADARRAAAELELAFATVADITRRANTAVRAEVVDGPLAPATFDSIRRPFDILNRRLTDGDPVAVTRRTPLEGSS